MPDLCIFDKACIAPKTYQSRTRIPYAHTPAHTQLPDYLPIDMEESMLGSVKPYARHVLFQTNDGKTPRNWPYKLEQVENSLAMELTTGAAAAGEKLGCRVVVTAVDDDAGQQAAAAEPLLRPEEVFVLPDMVALGPVTVDNARIAIEAYLTSGNAPDGLAARRVGAWRLPSGGEHGGGESGEDSSAHGPWSACVLVCAHKLRDKRCGIAAPLIMEQLRATCAERGLLDQVAVMGCSHVGGHKFAGNVIVYSSAGGHWYGRVKPCHADALVHTHIEQGRVLKELWRGRME